MASQTTSMAVICSTIAFASLAIGYTLGSQNSPIKASKKSKKSPEERESDYETESDEGEDVGDEDLAKVVAKNSEPCKLLLIVRTDLQMTKGKIAAQCGHATLACFEALSQSNPALVKHWKRTGQAKIALKCESEDELLILEATAKSLGICARSIQDAGRTQVAAGSTTVLGIGPAPVSLVNQITSHLKLL